MISWLPRRVLPVLMYHRIGDAPARGDAALWISNRRFAGQLDAVAQAGYRTLTLAQAHATFVRRHSPRRRVLLTFDDAFADTLESVLPMLDDHGLTAAVFVAADTLGREVTFASPERPDSTTGSRGLVAGRDLLLAWHAAGHGIGAHSASHAALTDLDDRQLARETAGAKATLEDALGVEVADFCYPYARHDAAARRRVAAAGYRAAYAGEPPTLDLFALPRMMVFPSDDRRRFERKLSGYYYFLAAWHRRLVRRSVASRAGS